MNLSDLDKHQQMMWEWHQIHYPDATIYRIALKATEELGEVAQAVVKNQSTDRIVEEVGDVINVLCSLLASQGRKISEAIEYASSVPERKRKKS